ncbi:MAG: oxidoreductase [Desulfobacula sp.]|uniref:zinc-binding dehydrogenase n=1 Tax=Desulfobacula sp. TaxID=2593537 RepID=UPI0025C3B1E7|nr:zinc-binding dehydrogenase [Desulfobacula sp.]MCD4721182.1 oxidoreductase [Desulfobacula sp.]
MDNFLYKALIVEEPEKNKFIRQIKDVYSDDLPKGDVLIRVKYSSLNYKDALSATGNRGVTRQYPHTPGIDAAGILSHLGYCVTAVSGKADTTLLNNLGVKTIIARNDFLENTKPPILKEQWAGVIDTVGGNILAIAIKSTKQDGIVTCCGNVASADLPINVFPFILRGISLLGIDSQHCAMEFRSKVWEKLATDWRFGMLENIYDEIFIDQLSDKIECILKGELRGRTLVNLN